MHVPQTARKRSGDKSKFQRCEWVGVIVGKRAKGSAADEADDGISI